ncbi:Bug family tripartite tricarboxylate transporter substrate binding protein [Roseomonas rosulenta]|uniref:Bug family tripartite tricarboxylate transporter substrate binding protein n=1 Tax=Roseomonas rosulenta TaxID=2748667 RepID=UPI0018E00CDD|nr:tripartite tricarboxylate transporter substrate binding protein [Roseomonas rosulenta]
MTRPNRRTLALLPAGLLALPALAQEAPWPNRPIRLVVAFPPGGLTDVMGRMVAQRLQAELGQPVVVENRGGAGGTTGTQVAVRSAPDGYTLAFAAPSTHVTGPILFPTPGYDGISDVAPIGAFASIASIAVVHPSVQATSIAELTALAKARPGTLNFGSAGAGGSVHLAGELYKMRAGIDIVHVPYRGGAAMLTDLLSGRVQIAFDNLPQILPHVRSGAVRGLAVTSRERLSLIPELPTMIEAGVPGYEIISWFGLTAPAGTPAPVVARMNAIMRTMVADPAVLAQLAQMGANPLSMTPEEFGAFLRAERERYGEIIRVSGARVD